MRLSCDAAAPGTHAVRQEQARRSGVGESSTLSPSRPTRLLLLTANTDHRNGTAPVHASQHGCPGCPFFFSGAVSVTPSSADRPAEKPSPCFMMSSMPSPYSSTVSLPCESRTAHTRSIHPNAAAYRRTCRSISGCAVSSCVTSAPSCRRMSVMPAYCLASRLWFSSCCRRRLFALRAAQTVHC